MRRKRGLSRFIVLAVSTVSALFALCNTRGTTTLYPWAKAVTWGGCVRIYVGGSARARVCRVASLSASRSRYHGCVIVSKHSKLFSLALFTFRAITLFCALLRARGGFSLIPRAKRVAGGRNIRLRLKNHATSQTMLACGKSIGSAGRSHGRIDNFGMSESFCVGIHIRISTNRACVCRVTALRARGSRNNVRITVAERISASESLRAFCSAETAVVIERRACASSFRGSMCENHGLNCVFVYVGALSTIGEAKPKERDKKHSCET